MLVSNLTVGGAASTCMHRLRLGNSNRIQLALSYTVARRAGGGHGSGRGAVLSVLVA